MLFMFAVRNRVHQHGPCVAASCPRCHNEVVLTYVIVARWFSAFFVPLIPISRRRVLMCPICSWQREVRPESEHLALEMIDITRQWKSHLLTDAQYAQRVDAFWSFVSPDASPAPSAHQPPFDQETPPSSAPPAPPAAPPGS